MSDYKISMIIPTFNVEDDLKRAIYSLLNQTIGFEFIEVLLVDDFSTDNTRQLILDYSSLRMKFYRSEISTVKI